MFAQLIPIRIVVTWMVLLLGTVAGPLLTRDSHGSTFAAVVVLTIAAVKVRLIGLDFMELRKAPWALRAAFETYCFALWSVLSCFFVFT